MLIESSFYCLISNYNKKHEKLFHALVFRLVIMVYEEQTVSGCARQSDHIIAPRVADSRRARARERARPLARDTQHSEKMLFTWCTLPASQPFLTHFNVAQTVLCDMQCEEYAKKCNTLTRVDIGSERAVSSFFAFFTALERGASKLPFVVMLETTDFSAFSL